MLQTLSQLPPVHIGYLALVLTGFTVFALALGVTHVVSNLPDRRR